MKNHIYMELSHIRFYCNLCGSKFFSKNDITKHFVSMHPETDIQCNIVWKPKIESIVKTILDNNRASCDTQKPMNCDNCSEKFSALAQWNHHLTICFLKQHRPYECTLCKKNFSDLKTFKFHSDIDHPQSPLSFSQEANSAIEKEIGKMLQISKLDFLKALTDPVESVGDKLKVKRYKCIYCSSSSSFKLNIENHSKACHKDKPCKFSKELEDLSTSDIFKSHPCKGITNSMSSTDSNIKRYRCGFCVKRMLTVEELQPHVKKHHPLYNDFHYYYWPDTKDECYLEDEEIYDCGYCSSICKTKIPDIKKHCDMLHSDFDFKVKGYIQGNKDAKEIVACAYCYEKIQCGEAEAHTRSLHASMPVKTFNNKGVMKRKEYDEEPSVVEEVNNGSYLFSCSHCGHAFTTLQQVREHSGRQHSRLTFKYDKLSSATSEEKDLDPAVLYRCEFCSFIGMKKFLESHIACRHKRIMSCGHCKKRFDLVTKLKEHHDAAHAGLKWAINKIPPTNCPPTGTEPPKPTCESSTGAGYGKKPEPIDLSTITVGFKINEKQHIDIPATVLFATQNLSPFVSVEYCNEINK